MSLQFKTICTFCTDSVCCQKSVFCHSWYFYQPPLWHSAQNTVHVVVMRRPSRQQTLASLFLLGKQWHDQTSFFDGVNYIFYPSRKCVCSICWLVVVTCERTCVLCEVHVHVPYDRDPRLLDRTMHATIMFSGFLLYFCLFFNLQSVLFSLHHLFGFIGSMASLIFCKCIAFVFHMKFVFIWNLAIFIFHLK